ncbi:MAG: hypothetical protein QM813_01230 [Verrucomicrobiota bacterium]
MDALLPIIRRKRRPLLPVEVVPLVAPIEAKSEPAAKPAETLVTDEKPKLSDDEVS